MIAIDTGPLVALFDKDDQYHKACGHALKGIKETLITTWPVLTEVMYLLNFSPRNQELCWEFIESGVINIFHLNTHHLPLIRRIMKKYQELPMDLADASILIMSEEKRITKIFTLDHKHFMVYSPAHTKFFQLIPKRL